jgi:hypothetical protein
MQASLCVVLPAVTQIDAIGGSGTDASGNSQQAQLITKDIDTTAMFSRHGCTVAGLFCQSLYDF